MSNIGVEVVWVRRMLRRLRHEGTAIVLATSCSDVEIREAVVDGRCFTDEDGAYVVRKKVAQRHSVSEKWKP